MAEKEKPTPVVSDAEITAALRTVEKEQKVQEDMRQVLLAYLSAKSSIHTVTGQVQKARQELLEVQNSVATAKAAHQKQLADQQREAAALRAQAQTDLENEKRDRSAEIDKLKKDITMLGKRVKDAETAADTKIKAADMAALVAESEAQRRIEHADLAAKTAEQNRDRMERSLRQLLQQHNLTA